MKIAILHFLPLKKYPPVVNFLNMLDKKNVAGTIKVSLTTNYASLSHISFSNIEVTKHSGLIETDKRVRQALHYVYFNLFAFFALISYRPNKVLSYDSLSVLPGIFYKPLFS